MIRRNAIIAAVLLAVSAAPSYAGIERAGTTAANFLQIGTGAGTLGMGGATLGLAGGDLGSITWNAASLAQLRETQIAFSHVGLAQSSAQEWAAVAGRMQSMPLRWAFTGLYQGDGSFEGRDALGNPTGDFNASSMAIGANGAYTFMEKVSLGLGVKYVTEALGGVHGSGIALDLGLHATHGRFGIGAALQNTAGRMKYEGAEYPFGANMGIGASMTDPNTGLRAAVDFNIPNAYYPDVRAGVEWMYHDRFALRTGYRYEVGAEVNEPMTGPTFGMGAGANGFWLDYALLMGGASGDGQHRVGLTFRPGALNLGSGGAVTSPTPSVGSPLKAPRISDAAPAPEKKKSEKPKKAQPDAAPTASKAPPLTLSPAPPLVAAKAAPTAPAEAPKVTPTPVPAKAAPAIQIEAPKPEAPKSEAIAFDAAPPRQMAQTPGSLPSAVKRAQAANVPSSTAPTKAVGTPKTMPFAVPAQATAKPGPLVIRSTSGPAKAAETKPAETKATETKATETKATETKAAEAPKPAETVPPQAETPKPAVVTPAETTKPAEAAPVVEAPKPVETKKAEPVKAEPEKPRPATVTVKKGQTLEDIAKEWGTSAAAIMMENNLVTQKAPKQGTKLKLPPKR